MRCINTGKIFPGRPTLGSWVSALWFREQNLPAFVVLRTTPMAIRAAATNWESGWLPAQDRQLPRSIAWRSRAESAAANTTSSWSPASDLGSARRAQRRASKALPQRIRIGGAHPQLRVGRPNAVACRAVARSIARPVPSRQLYGLDNPTTANFGTRCLMARRLIETGVRFVQVMVPIGTGAWDHHSNLRDGLRKVCPAVDLPTAALIRDLKQRGLLDSTIVMWTGEFGRLPISQGGSGRDHNRHAFTLLLAGGDSTRTSPSPDVRLPKPCKTA